MKCVSINPRAAAAVSLAAVVLLATGPASAAGWWSLDWPYRRSVTIDSAERTGLPGDDIAVVDMPTGGALAAGGKDIRVLTAGKDERACRVLMVGPGDRIKVAFAVQPGVKQYYVYFGRKDPPARKADLDVRRGVLLEMWKYPGGGAGDLEQIKKTLFGRSKPFVGAGFRDRIFLGHNPFGPHNRVASVFTAYLKCPADGRYQFVSSSQNASFLLVDDELVVDNGGWHRAQRDIRMSGNVMLKKGLHKLTMYHVTGRGYPIIVAAWRPPGAKKVKVIPPEVFAPVTRAKLGEMRRFGENLGADFLYEHAGEAFLADRYHQRFVFRGRAIGRLGRNAKWQWDFEDGQTASGERAEHVYLVDGMYTVKLTVTSGLGTFERVNRVWVSRPWDRVTENKIDSERTYSDIVAAYDLAALSPEAAAEAVLLFSRTGNFDAIRRTGDAFVAGKDLPPAAAELLMPIYADALIRKDRTREAVDALETVAGRAEKSPATAALLLAEAGRLALEELSDGDRALKLYERAIQSFGHLASGVGVRAARIGIGDVQRLRGDYDKAAKAYAEAGERVEGRGLKPAVARGSYVRYLEDFMRRREFDAAADVLREWEEAFPADKLEGYQSLMKARLLAARRKHRQAAREAEILVGVNPTSNYAADLLREAAEAYGHLKEADKQADTLRRIVKEYPESPASVWAADQLKKRQ